MSLAPTATAVLANRARYTFPAVFQPMFVPHRYKILYGGRGGGKSWAVARYLINLAYTKRKRIGCFRELQSSIKDSVHQLLCDQIEAMGLSQWFHITDKSIYAWRTGSEFLFKGLRHNANEIKSTEGVDVCWVEEAQLVSKESWDMVIPTIRASGSEIIVSFNPLNEEDDTYTRFVLRTPPDGVVIKANWHHNPWFGKELDLERRYCLEHAPEDYDHIWNGLPKKISDAVVFKNRWAVEAFETPPGVTFYHGADFGFANDPATLIRMFITEVQVPVRIAGQAAKMVKKEELWIDREVFGWGVEIDNLPDMYKRIETGAQWPISADSSRPEVISYLKRQGIRIHGAEKWPESVADGIDHLKAFHKIHVHVSCKRTQEEYRLHSYKVDKKTNLVLPEFVDAWNHSIDAQRYGLDKFIHRRGAHAMWSRLAK